MRLLQHGGESGIRTHEGLNPTAFRERHFRPLRHLSVAQYSISTTPRQPIFTAEFHHTLVVRTVYSRGGAGPRPGQTPINPSVRGYRAIPCRPPVSIIRSLSPPCTHWSVPAPLRLPL